MPPERRIEAATGSVRPSQRLQSGAEAPRDIARMEKTYRAPWRGDRIRRAIKGDFSTIPEWVPASGKIVMIHRMHVRVQREDHPEVQMLPWGMLGRFHKDFMEMVGERGYPTDLGSL